MIDPTISVGTMLQIIVAVAAAAGVVWALRVSVRVIETRLGSQDKIIVDMQNELKKLNQVVTDIAVQNTRMDMLEQRQMDQGKRLDEGLARFNRWMDAKSE